MKDIDIIHFYTFFWLNRAIMLLNTLFYHKKTILEITLYGDDDPVNMIHKNIFNRILSPLIKRQLKKIDKFVVLNADSFNSCIKIGIAKNKIWLRPNPVDEKKYKLISTKDKKILRKKLRLPDKFILLNVGTIQPRKNQMFLIKAVKKINKENILLVLIGPVNKDIPYYNSLLEYIKENKMEQQVIFLGEKNNVPEYLSAANLFVFASEREGFSNAIGESMMSGLPVILLYHSNIDDYVIEGKTGTIIKNKNADKALTNFSESIDKAYKKSSFISKEIRTYAENILSASKIDQQYNQIYNELKKAGK